VLLAPVNERQDDRDQPGDGIATFTMKKSRTIMKVPVSITASGAQVRCAPDGPAGPAAARARPRERLAVMGPPSAAGPRMVDYPAGNGPRYRRRLSCQSMAMTGQHAIAGPHPAGGPHPADGHTTAGHPADGRHAPVGHQLRSWRERRRLSQLDLSLRAGISARHLSFVETGRSRPSSGLIVRLSEELDVPLRDRNALLLAGGFAPVHPEHGLGAPSLSAVTEAMRQVITAHMPNPALAVDGHWELIEANDALVALTTGSAAHLLEPPVNVLRLSLHPDGVAPRIANMGQWRQHVLGRVRRQADRTGDPFLAELFEELRGYPAGDARPPAPETGAEEVAIPMRIRLGDEELSFLSTTTVFGSPLDVTVAELAIESFYPADERTAAAMRAFASTAH
jgi:transcriptional regulator with XRE-family HTH domain